MRKIPKIEFSKITSLRALKVMNNTDDLQTLLEQPLALHGLADDSRAAAEAFIAAGTAANTVRSYQSAHT